MKTLSRLFSAAFILFAAVSCGTKEIDHPDIPDTPQDSEITITASIIQTRVSYDCSDPGEVKQEWEVGDILFGFYGRSTSHQIVFRVSGVNTTTGVATLKAVSGADWIEEATVGGTAVDLVYTGGEAIFTDNGIDVDLSEQTLSRVPGCMHAQATLQIDGDGKKSLEFYFQNDCALIEIDGLTGIAESGLFGEGVSSLALSSVHITNLLLGGSYSFSNGELVFDSDEESLDEDYAIELESGWTVGNDGAISGPDREKILIAVAPNPEENQITVSSNVSTEMGSLSRSFGYGKRSLAGGLCYVISAQPVVARTADGQCFKSVSAAFARAEKLSDRYTTAADNVVTLIKKEIDGFGEQTASQTHRSSIDIYSNVTLDLNGCTLSLSEAEGFSVNNIPSTPTTFTITDSNGLNDAKYEGKIKSTSGNPIIINYGDVIIDGGELYYTFFDDPDKYNGRYSMIDNEGGSLTIDNDSYLQADGSIQDIDEECNLIKNFSRGTLEVKSGDLYSWDDIIITIGNSDGGTVTISGGEVYSDVAIAIHNDSNCTIKDGEVSSDSSDAVLNSGSLEIDGGKVYSNGLHAVKSVGGSITIDQPDEDIETLIYSFSETSPAIYVTADGSNTASFTMNGGTVTGYGFYSESEDICGAIELKGKVVGSISSGSIQTSNLKLDQNNYAGYALYVHDGSICTISGGEVKSNSSFLPSVFCYTSSTTTDGTSLTVRDGTITGDSGGVTLEGKVTGTFTGGEVDTIYGGSAVLVNNGSVCTISGGKYYKATKNSQDPTIRAFGRQNAGTKLTIKWPDVSQTGGETKPEPLIFVSDPSRACVGADLYGSEESYATVELLGGYYYIDYINAKSHNKTFFTRSVSAPIVQFGYIYTNQTGLKDGSNLYLLDTTSSSFTVNGKLIKAVAESSPISVSCQLCGQTKTIQFAYRVAPEGQ